MPLPTKPFLSLIALGLCAVLQTAGADPRQIGGEDTARHPLRALLEMEPDEAELTDEEDAERWRRDPDPVPEPVSDPAVEHFWSERCVQQRRYGLPHTKDCDNPAYTGSRSRNHSSWSSRSYPSPRPSWRDQSGWQTRPYSGYGGSPAQGGTRYTPPVGNFRLPDDMAPDAR